jgi:hypothetical protein
MLCLCKACGGSIVSQRGSGLTSSERLLGERVVGWLVNASCE